MLIDDLNIYSDVSSIELVEEMPRWMVLSSLGEGSKGEVFLARDHEGRRFALKKMYSKEELEAEFPSEVIPHLFDKEGVPHAARQEWEASQNLRHPTFVKVYQFYPGEKTYLLMEWIEGQTLDKVPFGSMDTQTALNLVLESIDGLAFAFNEGWIHHDLYSSNVMIDHFNHLKFIDLESFDRLSDEDGDMTVEEYRYEMISFFEDITYRGVFTEEQRDVLSAIFKTTDEEEWKGPLGPNSGPIFISFLEKIRDQITSLL